MNCLKDATASLVRFLFTLLESKWRLKLNAMNVSCRFPGATSGRYNQVPIAQRYVLLCHKLYVSKSSNWHSPLNCWIGCWDFYLASLERKKERQGQTESWLKTRYTIYYSTLRGTVGHHQNCNDTTCTICSLFVYDHLFLWYALSHRFIISSLHSFFVVIRCQWTAQAW